MLNKILSFFVFFVPWIGAFGIAREPTLVHALLLLEYLEYRPEARKARDAKQCRSQNALNQQRCHNQCHPGNGKPPPATGAKIIFSLNYYRVEQPDDEECRHTYHYSHPIHLRNQFCHIIFCFIRQSYHKASTLPNACGKALKKGAGNISRRLAYFIVLLMLHKRITSSKAFP